ncbi:MAG: NAD(P)-dependent oxidoreductase [Chloroflexi bacterium]|nr:NAD(P)-dependent oxidoreductase [Chloroflexota bacterium]MCC6895259.1 NAD(P)-dependent oxidoreductase [Anaerolineae bacterium]
MDVGFIGLGAMGLVMARNLCAAGHTVTVYNRTRSKAESLVEHGAKVADAPAEACKGEVVITLLSDDAAVADMVFGSGGVLNALAPDTVHVCMSTISTALGERLTEAHTAAGRAYVSAPVFGRPDAAEAAKLFIVAGGAAAAIARCQPAFDALGQRTFVVGEEPVKANITKISGNFLISAVIESLSEAFTLVRKYDIEPQAYLDLLTSTIFSAPVYKNYGGIIAQEKFDPPGFKLPLGLKDVRLAIAAGDETNTPLPIASLVRDHLVAAMAKGYGELDWSVLGRIAAQNAGLE